MDKLTSYERKQASDDFGAFIDLDSILDWINDNLMPSQVFDEGELAGWADANGYERPE